MTTLPIRTRPILVVAQDHRVRAALAAIVAANEHLQLSGQASSGLEARYLLTRDLRRHTVVVDLDVPVPAGPLALVADLAAQHDVIALTARRPRALSATSAGAVAVASTVEEVEESVGVTARTGPHTPAESEPNPRREAAAPDRLSMSPAGLVAVLLGVLLPPWAFWLAAIAQGAGFIPWRVPQGTALWSMVIPVLVVIGWRLGAAGLRDVASRVTRRRVRATAYVATHGQQVTRARRGATTHRRPRRTVANHLGTPAVTSTLPQ